METNSVARSQITKILQEKLSNNLVSERIQNPLEYSSIAKEIEIRKRSVHLPQLDQLCHGESQVLIQQSEYSYVLVSRSNTLTQSRKLSKENMIQFS